MKIVWLSNFWIACTKPHSTLLLNFAHEEQIGAYEKETHIYEPWRNNRTHTDVRTLFLIMRLSTTANFASGAKYLLPVRSDLSKDANSVDWWFKGWRHFPETHMKLQPNLIEPN